MNALPQISLQNEWQSFTTFLIGESHYTISETEFHFVMEFPAQEDLNLAFDHIYCLDNSFTPLPLIDKFNYYHVMQIAITCTSSYWSCAQRCSILKNYAVGQIMAIVNTSEKSARGYYTVT